MRVIFQIRSAAARDMGVTTVATAGDPVTQATWARMGANRKGDGESIDEAARAWAAAKAAAQRAQAVMRAKEPALRAYFEAHPDARDVAGVVGISVYSRVLLDRRALRAWLGDEIARFQQRKQFRTLTLLAEPEPVRAAVPRPRVRQAAAARARGSAAAARRRAR